MAKIPMNAISSVVEALLRSNAIRATKFLSDKQIVRAVRRNPGPGNAYILLTLGHPNYAERDFIRQCKRAKEPLPVKKILLKFKAKKKNGKAHKLKRK